MFSRPGVPILTRNGAAEQRRGTWMRDDVMAALAEKVMADDAFRQRARDDLDGALGDAGFDLQADEREGVEAFYSEYVGMSDEDLVRSLRRQGAG